MPLSPDLKDFLKNLHGITLGADGEFTDPPPACPHKARLERLIDTYSPWRPETPGEEPPF
jgi:hypothetical protein